MLPPIHPAYGKFSDPKWFDGAHPPAPGNGDYLIELVNGTIVTQGTSGPPEVSFPQRPFGELADNAPRFVWWSHVQEMEVRPERSDAPVIEGDHVWGKPAALRRDVDASMGAGMRRWHVRDLSEDEKREVDATLKAQSRRLR